MTISFADIWIYAAALFVLVISPGPVVAAIVARVLSRGFSASWPLAFAVFFGDMFWVASAIFTGSLLAKYDILFEILRFGGAAYLVYLGIQEIRNATAEIGSAEFSHSTKFLPNFLSGLFIILTNPKAAFFYLVFVPRFFDLTSLTKPDIGLIVLCSSTVPLIGNLIWASVAQFAASQFKSQKGRARLRIISGTSLIIVGISLLFLH